MTNTSQITFLLCEPSRIPSHPHTVPRREINGIGGIINSQLSYPTIRSHPCESKRKLRHSRWTWQPALVSRQLIERLQRSASPRRRPRTTVCAGRSSYQLTDIIQWHHCGADRQRLRQRELPELPCPRRVRGLSRSTALSRWNVLSPTPHLIPYVILKLFAHTFI